ncbi:MAG: TonB-dependent receptor plug domain-containing protein [Crocinitomicaceae bacterium]
MQKYLFSTLMLFSIYILSAQNKQIQLTILDNSTLQPIENVKVFNVEKNQNLGLSDKNGKVSLTMKIGYIVLIHPEYLKQEVLITESASEGVVYLRQNQNSLEEVVVSASKFEEKRKDVAQKIQVMKASEIQNFNQSSTADVMANSGNVFVQKSQLGGGSPIIRGFETNKVLIVIDGIRMNNAIYRGGHLQNIITLDNSIMDRAEVVFGPGSVVYGSDAIGGVMSFTTKDPKLSPDGKILFKSNAYTRYFSAANGFATNANVSVGTKRFGSLTSFTYSKFGDLRQGSVRSPLVGNFGARNWYVERINGIDSMVVNADTNKQVGSAYNQYDILQKFTFKQSETVTHKMNFQLSNSSNIDRYDRLTLMSGSNPRFAEWYYGPQFRMLAGYSLILSKKNSLYDHARITIGYQSIEESRMDRRFKKDLLNHRIENLDIITANADFAKKLGDHEFRYGLDGFYNKVNSTAYVKDIVADTTGKLDTRYPDGGSSMSSVAAYLTHTWEITDKLILNDGIRYSNIGLSANFIDKTFFPFPFNDINQRHNAINGNLGLIFMPTSKWRFTLSGSTGFRAPNVDDLSKVFESVPGSIVVPNPNLKAEYSYSGEFGLSYELAPDFFVGGNAYYTLLTNALTVQNSSFDGQDSIVFDGQLSQVRTTTNAGQAYVYGFEGMISGKLSEHFNLVGTVNYTKGRIKTDSIPYPLDHIPPVFGKISLGYTIKKFNAEFFVNYSGWKRLEDYNFIGEDNYAYATPQGMPSWYTLNLRLNFRFNKYASLQVACENILDHNYRNFASNISAPGRNFIVTLRGNF